MTNASSLIPDNYDALKDAYVETAQENESLRRQVEFYRKHFFGTKSERSHLSPSDQTSLLEAAERAEAHDSGDTAVAAHGRKRRTRKEAEDGLPLVTIVHDLPEAKKQCACGKAMEAVKEERTVVREYQPPKLFLEEHLTPCYQCPACQNIPCSAPTPSMPIENGTLGPGLLACVTRP